MFKVQCLVTDSEMKSLFYLVLFLTIELVLSQNKAEEQCRKHKEQSTFNQLKPTVIGGVRSARYQFPYMVALLYGDEKKKEFYCGGTLISSRFVLTAAHCLTNKNAGQVKWVRLGTTSLQTETNDYGVIERIKHPEYKPPLQYHDIALLKLDSDVPFSPAISPICLDTNPNATYNALVAMGWGKLDFTGPISQHLMHVDLTLFSHAQCQKVYGGSSKRKLPEGIVDRLQLCAGGGADEEKDTCHGDSGGPLVVRHWMGDILVGVTSFGKACGLANTPGVYTRVVTYVPWIEEIVWG